MCVAAQCHKVSMVVPGQLMKVGFLLHHGGLRMEFRSSGLGSTS